VRILEVSRRLICPNCGTYAHVRCQLPPPGHISERATTSAASAVGNDQAHSPIMVIAIAATTHPIRKPKRRYSDRFNRPPSALISGWPCDRVSMMEKNGVGKIASHNGRGDRSWYRQAKQRILTRHGGNGDKSGDAGRDPMGIARRFCSEAEYQHGRKQEKLHHEQ
jgi:hypothetical protein